MRTIHGFCHGVIDEHAMSIGVGQGLKAQALGSAWIERGIAGWWREAVLHTVSGFECVHGPVVGRAA